MQPSSSEGPGRPGRRPTCQRLEGVASIDGDLLSHSLGGDALDGRVSPRAAVELFTTVLLGPCVGTRDHGYDENWRIRPPQYAAQSRSTHHAIES